MIWQNKQLYVLPDGGEEDEDGGGDGEGEEGDDETTPVLYVQLWRHFSWNIVMYNGVFYLY